MFLRWEFEPKTSTTAPNAAGDGSADGAAPTDKAAKAAPAGGVEDIGVKYKADVAKCMRGEPLGGSSMVGGGTCKSLQRAAQTGDASGLPAGAAEVFLEIRKKDASRTKQ